MAVRLAYEQGLFKGPYLNWYQRWALSYWIYLQRRIQIDDWRDMQELQTFELLPERWRQLHFGGFEEIGGQAYTGVTDPRQVDKALEDFLDTYGDSIDAPRQMAGSELYGLEV